MTSFEVSTVISASPERVFALFTDLAHAPDRVVWGTDWPHPNHTAIPNDGELVDLIAEIAPDEKTRHLMLVDNPAKLFGF